MDVARQQFQLFDQLPIGVMAVGCDFAVLSWNKTLADWTGMTPETVVGGQLTELFPEFSRKANVARLESIFADGPPVVFSSQLHPHILPCPLPWGGLRSLHTVATALPSGKAGQSHALLAVQDVTDLAAAIKVKQAAHAELLEEVEERKRTEEALRRNQFMLSKAQSITRVGSWILDAQSGEVDWSSEMAFHLGVSPAELGDDLEVLVRKATSGEDRERVLEAVRLACNGGKGGPVAYEVVKSDRSMGVLSLEAEALRNADGSLAGAVGTVQDITQRRRAEEERRSLEEKVQHAQKLESLGVLAGGIAHDFNNLLMIVLGNASVLLEEMAPGHQYRTGVEAIETASRRAADLAGQMLAYAGRGRFVVEEVNLNTVAEEMKSLLLSCVGRNTEVVWNLQPELPSVQADRAQLQQVVMNLIANGAEAVGEEEGLLLIQTGTVECDRSYLHQTVFFDGQEPGTYVYFEVSDTGCGMDIETQRRIFDPFFTTKFVGRGLGLAATLGIIRSHKGAISVCSEQRRGTIVRVLLPTEQMPATGEGGDETETGETWPLQGTVLLVDDEEGVLYITRRMLERLGFDVLTAKDGREAVDVFTRCCEHIDAGVVDLTMPRLDGIEAIREMRRQSSEVRIVLCTGYPEEDCAERFDELDLSGFIQKPYTMAGLKRVLGPLFAAQS
jgi:PAS domain S-box-containing protein